MLLMTTSNRCHHFMRRAGEPIRDINRLSQMTIKHREIVSKAQ
jgi:hypothetical protein